MLFNKSLTIVVASNYEAFSNVRCLDKSIREHLPDWEVSTQALIYNAGDINFQCEDPNIRIFHTSSSHIPIVDSRNICQSHLRKIMNVKDCLGVVLDDDLVWQMPQQEFQKLVVELLSLKSDMVFLGLCGDPPIPKEYTRACAMLDALVRLEKDSNKLPALSRYISDIEFIPENTEEHYHHDFYSFNKSRFHPMPFNMKLDDFIHKLYQGKLTTRPLIQKSSVKVATGRERGGATLIMDSDVLKFKNQSIKVDNYISRRSDMLMAVEAKENGFNLHSTPPVLIHCRSESFDSHDPSKLISDMLGYSYIEHIQHGADMYDVFLERFSRTLNIINETNRMFQVMEEVLNPASSLLLTEMICENIETIKALKSFSDAYKKSDFLYDHQVY